MPTASTPAPHWGKSIVNRLGLSGRRARRKFFWGLFFVSPWIIGFIAFTAFPMVSSFYYSLTNYTVLQNVTKFLGAHNYTHMLHDHFFWTALYNTAYLAIFFVPLNILIGIGIAVLLNAKIHGQAIFRTLAYLPTIVPAVASAILWLWLLNPLYGVINGLLGAVGISGPGWLASPIWSKPAYVMMSLWQSLGNTMLIFLAGLQGVPVYLVDSAKLDGAGPLLRFRHVTLPMISPMIFFNTVLGIINSFIYFTQAYVITSSAGIHGSDQLGAPLNSALFYVLYIYQAGFNFGDMGYASGLAWVLFIIIMVLTVILTRSSGRWVYYESVGR
jgi:multiple sugar transport system permease protein